MTCEPDSVIVDGMDDNEKAEGPQLRRTLAGWICVRCLYLRAAHDLEMSNLDSACICGGFCNALDETEKSEYFGLRAGDGA